MKLARSTYYYRSRRAAAAKIIVRDRIVALCDEFPRYGYRRVTAQLKAEGTLINHKTVSRIMRANGLQVRPLRRFVRTTDSDHNGPIFPNLVREFVPTMSNQLWVADLSYIAIAKGFVYLAAVLDAWSRRVVGYALSRRLDTRLALAALNVAIETRRPPPGCIHHSDRGTQGEFKRSSQHLEMESCDDYKKAPFRSMWAITVAVAGSACGSTAGEL
jgi:putative transposase